MLTARQRTALGESEARGLWMHPPRYHLVGSLSATREDAAYPAGWLFDRLEIEAALTRNVLVIPVLVEGAQMPGQSGCRPAWRNWRIGKPRSLAGRGWHRLSLLKQSPRAAF